MNYPYLWLAYLLFAVLLVTTGHAQDVVYLTDQTSVTGTLTDLAADKLSMQVKRGESAVKYTYNAERVALVVNRRARLLCLDQLGAMPLDEQGKFIKSFMTDNRQPANDLLIRDNPVAVIYGRITSADGEQIRYATPNGTPASLLRSDLIGLFYRDGRHELQTTPEMLCAKIDMSASDPPPVAQAAVRAEPPAPAAAPPSGAGNVPTGASNVLKLTDAEYDDYRTQALDRVQEFGVMLGIVADKTVDAVQKDKAISQILKMFQPGATIEVSSVARGGQPAAYRLKDYLMRLKLIPYKNVTLEWSEIQYVQELTQKADGNYYGKIRGEQRFSGLGQRDEVQYSDITQKDVDVMLTPYKKQIEGGAQGRWAVLLGNVGVVATQ